MINNQTQNLAMVIGWSLLLLIPIEAFRYQREVEKRDLDKTNGRHILEDTYKYQSEINWTVHTNTEVDYDYEEWEDLTVRMNMKREYSICDRTSDEHWLRTKYIQVPKDRFADIEVNVEIEYAFLKCDVAGWSDCKNTFSVYKWESKDDIANDNIPSWEDSDGSYEKLKTIAAQDMFDDKSDDQSAISTEVIRFTPSESGFYIAFKTTGTCMSLHRVQIYYYVCPELRTNLAEFPATATMSDRNKKVEGRCVDNAHLIDSRQKPIAHCSLAGTWVTVSNQCKCYDGYYELDLGNSQSSCNPCPAETYRSNSMKKCLFCPRNRESIEGQASCQCKLGYRQLEDSSNAKPCYKPAMQTKEQSLHKSPTSVQFTLRAPTDDSEKERLRYLITVCEGTVQGGDEPFECVWKDKEIRFNKRGMNQIKVPNLKPLTQYDITVTAVNIVSRSDDENTLTFSVRTPQKVPDKVMGLSAVQNPYDKRAIMLKWERPSSGKVAQYNIKYRTKDSPEKTLNVSTTVTNITDITAGTEYYFFVAAVNEAGYSSYQESKLSVPPSDDVPITILLVAAASGILIVISVIVCAYCCCCRSVPRKKIPRSGSHPNTEMVGLVGDAMSYPVLSPQSNGPRALNDYEVGPDSLMPNFDYMEIDPINIQMETDMLGEGEFAEVRKAYITNKLGERYPVAAKTLKSGVGMRAQLDFLEEGQILQGFNHPSIIPLKGVVTKHRPMMILSEYMENGSLDEYLRRTKGEITVLQMIEILKDVASGMAYLAERGFIHRDIAARNILVDKQQQSKISDFGLSRLMETNENNAIYMAHGGKIAIKWTAPEAIKHKKFTNASDVWSFGILCWEVMTYGERPFWEMANDEVIESISNGLRLPCPYGCPIVLHDLMVDCWNHKAEDRPTFKQLEAILQNYLTNPSLLDNLPKSMEPTLPHTNNRCSTLYTTLQ